jgi:excisionase family DNA binding protein
MNNDLLTVEETIQRLRIGRTKLYELAQQGEIASMTIGRRRLFPESAVAEFIVRKLQQRVARG